MSPYAISPLLCTIFVLSLGTFVLLKNLKSPINRSFALLCFETFHWQAIWFISYYLATDVQINLFARIVYSLILFLPSTYYHFIVRLLNLTKEMVWVWRCYFVGIAWLILLWTTDLFIAGYHQFSWGYYPKVGLLHPVYLVFVALAIMRLMVLLKRSTRDPSRSVIARNQNRFVFLAACFYCVAAIEYLINYGVGFYPIGVYFILASFSVIAYAIVKYNLMGIEEAFKELLAKTLSFLFIGGGAFLLILLCLKQFGLKFQVLFVLIAMGVMALIIPLIRKVSVLISRTIRPRPNFQAILKNYTEVDMMTQHTSRGLAELVVKRITDTLRPTVCSLMLLDETTGLYNVIASSGKDEEIKTIAFKQTNHLISALKNSHHNRLIVKDELDKLEFSQEDIHLINRDLEILKSQISIPLVLHGELLGLLNLGLKSSGELYTPEEMGFLYIFLTQSAFMMEFLDKIQRIHELEVKEEKLAGMTNLLTGFEHEINNQMIPTQTYLNLEDESTLSEDMKSFRKSALGGFENITMILNSVRDYCESADVRYPSSTDIKESIISSLSKFQDKFTSINVKITTDIPANLPKAETFLCFKHLFPNLFRNCYYGLTQRKTRLLDIKVRQTKDSQRPLEIVITDTGGDLLNRMDRKALSSGGEDAPERSGIGGINFFIAKLIVNDHQGELIVSTNPPPAPDEQAGTIFTIKLPLSQPKA